QSCLTRHLRLLTLSSTPIPSQEGYFRERMRSYRMEALRWSSCTDTMDALCSHNHVSHVIYGYLHFSLHRFRARKGILVSGRGAIGWRPSTGHRDEDKHESMFIQPHDPDFVPEPIYLEYIPLEDEHIFPAKEQPLPPGVSPTFESLGYVAESDPKEDSEEYEYDKTEDGPADYPMDRGDDGDDDDGDSLGYNADDEDEDEEEEEHLALADSAVVIPTDELVSPPEEAEVERLLAMPTPSPSPLTSLSPPSARERLARCTAPAALPSPPLPPSLYPPPPVDCRDDIPESEQPPHKRVCLSTLGSRHEVGESSTRGRGVGYGFADTVEAKIRHQDIREVGYRIRDTWIDPAEAVPEIAPTTLKEVNTRVTKLAEFHKHDTQDLYALLENAQDGDSMDREGGGLCCPRGLGSFDRVEPDKTLRVMKDMRRQMGDMQAELLALCGQSRKAGQPGGDARVPNHHDAPRDANSHI
nr:hypothetical protein [Tanacetum cinerariifolium]